MGPTRVLWNVDPRNPRFVGRKAELASIERVLRSSRRGVIQALNGMGGVGKTQLALEYAHRTESRYNVVWWMNAERHELLPAQFQSLAVALDLAWALR